MANQVNVVTFSIIIPVYNTKAYLPECIKSILSQSFTDFEVLLVDDGSTDGSGSLCDEYARLDNRIRVFHEENRGVCSARNKGLDESKGEFIVFIDADDYITDCLLAHLVSPDTDVVMTGIEKFGAQKEWMVPKHFSSYGVEELPLHWNTPPNMNYLFCFTSAKRFRSRIIQENRIRFNESTFFSEDMCFCMLYFSYAQSFTEIPFADYKYRMENINRDDKFKMTAGQLICHYEYLDSCFHQLYDRIGAESLSFVRDNTCLRIMRKFYYFLRHENIGYAAFVHNIKKFREMGNSNYLLSLLHGKREKAEMNLAVRFPLMAYFEKRLLRFTPVIQ